MRSRQEYSTKYDFVITKIDVDAKGSFTFYDSTKCEYRFTSYRFTKWDKLRVLTGDKVFKNSYSKDMFVSRKINNKYKIFFIQKSNGMIPFSFYGNDNIEKK